MRHSARGVRIAVVGVGWLLAASGDAQGQLFGRERHVVVASPYGPGPSTVVVNGPRITLKPVFDPIRDALSRLKSQHNKSRRDGALTLGRIGDPRAVPDLVWMLQNDRDREVREAAALALGGIGDARALNALRVAALTDRNRHVRQAAHHAHGKILFDAPVVASSTVIESVVPTPVEVEVVPGPTIELRPEPIEPAIAPGTSAFLRSTPISPAELPSPLPPPASELGRDPEPDLDPIQSGDIPPGPLSVPLPLPESP